MNNKPLTEGHYDMLTIIGPTASGKTELAVAVARMLDGEIISGDSRQIYRGMTLGTGKDLDDYSKGGEAVKYHLIDIADAGERYNIYDYQKDFLKAYNDIKSRGKLPILCGGSGMYVECILKGYRMIPVPENKPLRDSLQGKSLEELTEILKGYGKKLHNTTDTDTPKRAIRAIEIEDFYQKTPVSPDEFPNISSMNVCLSLDREARWNKIEKRLGERLEAGMVDEIRDLLGHLFFLLLCYSHLYTIVPLSHCLPSFGVTGAEAPFGFAAGFVAIQSLCSLHHRTTPFSPVGSIAHLALSGNIW